jgi:hypothetical protein
MSKARDIASAAPAPSTVSATELGYVDGVTSAIQTQLDAKTAKSTLTTTGDIYYASGANTPARLGIGSTGNVLTVASGIPSWAAPAGGALPTFSAYDTNAVVISANVFTKLDFTTESWDTGSAFASSRFTPLTAGYYSVSGMIGSSPGSAETVGWAIYKNGSIWQYGQSLGSVAGSKYTSGNIIVYLNGSTDYIELYGTASYNATIGGGASIRYFAAVGIRS